LEMFSESFGIAANRMVVWQGEVKLSVQGW
jgi:hypothetical protein